MQLQPKGHNYLLRSLRDSLTGLSFSAGICFRLISPSSNPEAIHHGQALRTPITTQDPRRSRARRGTVTLPTSVLTSRHAQRCSCSGNRFRRPLPQPRLFNINNINSSNGDVLTCSLFYLFTISSFFSFRFQDVIVRRVALKMYFGKCLGF